ncbi:MAG: aspartate kinase [Flavobacteriales bacterium]|nr:aspartate kinase [Flavobacteriales bacterium]|tara:strand:- start:54037 stop:55353 length:1317 start_codon:yes stop_codon:yes gene_type:complete
MKVLKFGGTSVGSAERMKGVADIVVNDEPKIVVLSAMSGTTNSLVAIGDKLYADDKSGAKRAIADLEHKYFDTVQSLYIADEFKEKANLIIKEHFDFMKSFVVNVFNLFQERALLAQGELLSTKMFHLFLEERGVESALLPALDFMRINRDEEPDMEYIREHAAQEIDKRKGIKLFITQGYICRNSFGEIDNLKRGGSDYTASIVGNAVNASEVQIWTDIDGMHNNDPRVVDKTKPVAKLSFDEAAELAYFGAKILHPQSIRPAAELGIPVKLLNTMDPKAKGTTISKETGEGLVKAIAAKDGITAIKIKSARMLLAYGFLRSVFEVFERFKTPIDMITTSEVAVSLTIDDTSNLDKIVSELEAFGIVEVDNDQSIVCIVGNMVSETEGVAINIFEALKNVPIRMISYGGSRHNVSLVVDGEYKQKALQSLNDGLFNF